MMRQPDTYLLIYRDGTRRLVKPQSFERLVRGPNISGFWRVWRRK
ncbi:hypothetical protein [Altericroceibacterium spongiae]|nr:hypothetical protein [Altericroceibacterium spongiae]